jgi:hypothetical protein
VSVQIKGTEKDDLIAWQADGDDGVGSVPPALRGGANLLL